MKTFEQALEDAKEIIADDLKFAMRQKAAQAIGQHQVWNNERTGHLVQNIDIRIKGDKLEISMPFYGTFLEYGTGLYGPKKQVIKPKDGKVLSWESGGKRYFAAYTKGMTPAPFIRPTFHQDLVDIIVRALNIAFKDIDVNNL